jgi:hypothetical protein
MRNLCIECSKLLCDGIKYSLPHVPSSRVSSPTSSETLAHTTNRVTRQYLSSSRITVASENLQIHVAHIWAKLHQSCISRKALCLHVRSCRAVISSWYANILVNNYCFNLADVGTHNCCK